MNGVKWFVLVAASALLAGCSSHPASSGCHTNADCKAGSICDTGTCFQLCTVQSNCPADQICNNGRCGAPVSGALPEIDTVAGNDPSDSQHIRDGLVITGKTLADADFELRGSSGAAALTVRSQTDTQAEVVLPVDVRSGDYELVATNAAGSSQSSVTLQLPELTGDELVTRINSSSSTLAIDRLPVGPSAGQPASSDPTLDDSYYPRAEADGKFALKSDAAATQSQVAAMQPELDAVQGVVAGANLVPNGGFFNGLTGWSLTQGPAGSLAVVTLTDGQTGSKALENTPALSGPSWVSSDTWVPVDPQATYRLTATVRVVSGSASTFSVGVRFQDAGNNELLTGSGAWPVYAADAVGLTDTAWHTYSVTFGADGAQAFPANAATMTVGLVLNADPSTPTSGGNRSFDVQGIGITRLGPLERVKYVTNTSAGVSCSYTSTVLYDCSLTGSLAGYIIVNGGGWCANGYELRESRPTGPSSWRTTCATPAGDTAEVAGTAFLIVRPTP